MEIRRDIEGPPLPDDPQISWMNHTKRIKIDGDRLNEIFLISDEKYYSFYHVLRMDITYPYKISLNTGTCRVSFSFSSPTQSYGPSNDSELTFEFPRISHEKYTNNEAKKDIYLKLERAIRDLVEKEYEKILHERQ